MNFIIQDRIFLPNVHMTLGKLGLVCLVLGLYGGFPGRGTACWMFGQKFQPSFNDCSDSWRHRRHIAGRYLFIMLLSWLGTTCILYRPPYSTERLSSNFISSIYCGFVVELYCKTAYCTKSTVPDGKWNQWSSSLSKRLHNFCVYTFTKLHDRRISCAVLVLNSIRSIALCPFNLFTATCPLTLRMSTAHFFFRRKLFCLGGSNN